jgi:hypothetical protein
MMNPEIAAACAVGHRSAAGARDSGGIVMSENAFRILFFCRMFNATPMRELVERAKDATLAATAPTTIWLTIRIVPLTLVRS